jgi:hypothetical protein
MHPCCGCTSLWSIQLLPLLSLPPSLPPQLSVHILMSSTCTDVMLYDVTDALTFSLPFPPPLLKLHFTVIQDRNKDLSVELSSG